MVWQDDGDTKHRTQLVQETINNFFERRVPIDEQSPKMADIWPIENVWGILRQRLGVDEVKTLAQLKKKNYSRMAKNHS